MAMGFNEFQHHPLALAQQQQNQGGSGGGCDAMSVTNGPSSLREIDVERGYFSELDPKHAQGKGYNGGKHSGQGKGKAGNGFKKNMWGAGHRSRNGSVNSSSAHHPQGTATSDGISSHRRFSNLSGLGSGGAGAGAGAGTGAESTKSPTNVNGFVGLYGDQITEEPPAVTNLEESRSAEQQHQHSTSTSTSIEKKRISQSPTLRKAFGQRTASETDKGRHAHGAMGSPTAASFDSGERPTTAEHRASVETGVGVPLSSVPKTPTKSSTMRSKSKKDTSAYTKGLEKKTPQEQLASGCDFYGWMKKRSSNLMTTWRPRFFILHGRRLSYYYSEEDTEERGVIDISGHRVIADNDVLVSLHASLTGSKAVPATSAHPIMDGEVPSAGTTTKGKRSVSGGSDIKGKAKKHGATPEANNSTGTPATTTTTTTITSPSSKDKHHHNDKTPRPFIFKLVPPKPGAARSVQFTKPSVHYFQVDNISQGRLWMAAMLKATIERDANLPVRTTNKQKTISLRQAAASNQRPPALMGKDERGM
ncbi:hypothetical protein KEM56_004094, partial [Ascosphaera pollenicola]